MCFKYTHVTFVLRFAEDGVMVGDCHQIDVIVVDDVLRVLEPVVSAQKIIDRRRLRMTKLVTEDDVENLS